MLMTKDELEQEIDDLQDEVESRERTLSRAQIKIKRLTEQLKTRVGRVEELEREIRKQTKKHQALLIKFEKLGNLNKDLEDRISHLNEQLEKSEKQNATLRQIVEMSRASSAEPNYDALRQPHKTGA